MNKGILVGPARWFGGLLVDPVRYSSSSPGSDSGPEFGPDSIDGGEKYPSQSPRTLPNQTIMSFFMNGSKFQVRIMKFNI